MDAVDNRPDAEPDFSQEELDQVLDQVEHWYTQFAQSEQYGSLSDYPQMVGASVVLYYAEYHFTYLGQRPEEWSVQGMEEVCLHVMPSKIAGGAEFFGAVPEVLSTFLDYLDKASLLPQAAQLRKRLNDLAPEIGLKAEDESKWSMSKVFAMMALKAGVDLDDEDQVRHFMQMVNTTFEEQAWKLDKDDDIDPDTDVQQ